MTEELFYIGTRNEYDEICGLFYMTQNHRYHYLNMCCTPRNNEELVEVTSVKGQAIIKYLKKDWGFPITLIDIDEAKGELTRHRCYMHEIQAEIEQRLRERYSQ